MPEISKLAKFILHADDANIFVTGSTVEEVYHKYMIFTRNRSFVEQELKIANVVIERKISVRFLFF